MARFSWLGGLLAPLISLRSAFADQEQVTFYPACGFLQSGTWFVPLRARVWEPRPVTEMYAAKIAASMGELSAGEISNFRQRMKSFLSDSESRELVRFVFDHDSTTEEFFLTDAVGTPQKTDLNGVIEGILQIPDSTARRLFTEQRSQGGWLAYHAVSPEHTGTGRLQLVPPAGISIISDIDDTLRVTDVPGGPVAVVRNTLFRDFVAIPETAAVLQESGAAVHYVSGSPWQLYEPLRQFLIEEQRLPAGSFHMKSVNKNLLSASTWKDLNDVVLSDSATQKQKLLQIRKILTSWPERQFILVGDSGESDPEIYRTIRDEFPNQVLEIWIRDVSEVAGSSPNRLKDMKVIPTKQHSP